ncbi:hypothetical protein QJ048_01910 [Pinibacter sp. MAH-24]|uniref:Uncharacterized protein n=2 Tax=Pinibacter soli TaxID=3044211 RepID=A0ABT6R7F9_9BACT|nr:hypothetical protein [Pinibacter soli]
MFNFFLALMKFLTITSGIISVISFFLFSQARMRENEEQEQLYKKVHFTALTLFCIAGVILLNMLASTETH